MVRSKEDSNICVLSEALVVSGKGIFSSPISERWSLLPANGTCELMEHNVSHKVSSHKQTHMQVQQPRKHKSSSWVLSALLIQIR